MTAPSLYTYMWLFNVAWISGLFFKTSNLWLLFGVFVASFMLSFSYRQDRDAEA